MANNQEQIEFSAALEDESVTTSEEEETNDSGDEDMIKFWKAQPTPGSIKQDIPIQEGPLKVQQVEDIPTQPTTLPPGLEWSTLDPTHPEEMNDIWTLLNGQYVEDDDAMFRFNYSKEMLRWALTPPGWKPDWHIGIRSSASHKLLAFISATPKTVRVRTNVLSVFEFNFLCIDRELRGKRLTPILITEVTRKCNLEGRWHALHTGGVKLPHPVSVCRYFHRSLNLRVLLEVGFSGEVEAAVGKYTVPDATAVNGLREMERGDVDAVQELWARYGRRFDIVPQFNREEIEHWFVSKKGEDEEEGERVLRSYVVEDPNKKITDFFSFYCVEHSVLDPEIQTKTFRVGYLFYYATSAGFQQEPFNKAALKKRLNVLMEDAIILANRAKLDVLNALSMMDNALFLKEQKFNEGTGQLYYYISNYTVNLVRGGMDEDDELDEDALSGVALAML